LGSAPRQVADEEDAALSAFRSFYEGAKKGRFPKLHDRRSLWSLLMTITARKVGKQIRKEHCQKRGGGKTADGDPEFHQVIADGPTPEMVILFADEYTRLMDLLPDETLRRIAELKLQGFANAEIARQLACGVRTVERKSAVIRSKWLREGPRDD